MGVIKILSTIVTFAFFWCLTNDADKFLITFKKPSWIYDTKYVSSHRDQTKHTK